MWSAGQPLDILIPQTERSFLARNLWSELTFDDSARQLTFRPLYRTGEYTLKREGSR